MELIHLCVGRLQTNCYIVWAEGSKTCAVIDPGDEPERILKNIKDRGLTLEAVLLTHGHFDHVGAANELRKETDCRVYMDLQDLALPDGLTAGCIHYTHALCGSVSAGGLDFTILQTPGHSAGSICLLHRDVMFSGDTLFAGTCGRSDLPTGSWSEILKSLKMLARLPQNYTVYPGHGPATTLDSERANNPYMVSYGTEA